MLILLSNTRGIPNQGWILQGWAYLMNKFGGSKGKLYLLILCYTHVTRVPCHPWTCTNPVFPYLRPSNEWTSSCNKPLPPPPPTPGPVCGETGPRFCQVEIRECRAGSSSNRPLPPPPPTPGSVCGETGPHFGQVEIQECRARSSCNRPLPPHPLRPAASPASPFPHPPKPPSQTYWIYI
jgi:hypothetical protein